ncbi:MAG: Yip1 family protein [Bacillota bacterium]
MESQERPVEAESPKQEGWLSRLLEFIYGTLFQPVPTARRLAEERPLGMAALVYLTATALTGSFNIIGLSRQVNVAVLAVVPAAMVMVLVTLSVAVWLVYTGLLQIIAELFGGRGKGLSLLAATGFAGLPSIFMPVVGLISRAAGWGLEALFSLLLSVWAMVLMVIAVRESHQLSTGRSILTVLAPLVAGVFTVILLVIIVMATLASLPFLWDLPGLPGIF